LGKVLKQNPPFWGNSHFKNFFLGLFWGENSFWDQTPFFGGGFLGAIWGEAPFKREGQNPPLGGNSFWEPSLGEKIPPFLLSPGY